MSSNGNPGRTAGLWYLLLVACGPLRLLYIPSKLYVHGNATATIGNIAAHERLFQAGIAGELLGALVLIFLVLAFYRWFKGVDRNLVMQVIFFGGVMPAVLDFLNATLDLGVLTFARGGGFLGVFDRGQLDAFGMLFLRLGDHANTAAELLWGVWLVPLGLLVYRSRFIPRFLGVWLVLNGFAYVAVCFTGIFAPRFQDTVFNRSFPIMLGEIALMLWLVIRGAKPPQLVAAAR